MAAGAFKAKCLQVMDEVQAKGISVLITKRGKAVARIVPVEEKRRNIFEEMKEMVTAIHGEVDVPIIPESDWKRFK